MKLTVIPLLEFLDGRLNATHVDLILTYLQKAGHPTIFNEGSGGLIRGWALISALKRYLWSTPLAEDVDPDAIYIIGVDPLGLRGN